MRYFFESFQAILTTKIEMILDNENKKLSRYKKRIEKKIKMDDNMKLLLNKIRTEKKRKILIKLKIWKFFWLKKYANSPGKLQSAYKELKKIHVVNDNLHEIKQEILGSYNGDFEMIGKLLIGDQIRQTHIRFRNTTDYEAYNNSIDDGYDAEDSIFNGYIYKVNTRHFN